MRVPCPVCQNTMQQTGNPNLHVCPPRKLKFPRFNAILEMSHASVALDEEGTEVWKNIVSGEYSFVISYGEPKTVIKYFSKIEKKSPLDLDKNKRFEWKDLITINAVVDLPWHNTAKVAEHVKTYVVFS